MRAGEAGEISVRGTSEDRLLNEEEMTLSETRKYRKFSPQQKLELVLASWRGERSIAELCREHDISESLLRRWREQAVEAGIERFAAGGHPPPSAEQRQKNARAEGAPGGQTPQLGNAGKTLRGRGE